MSHINCFSKTTHNTILQTDDNIGGKHKEMLSLAFFYDDDVINVLL